MQRLDTWGIPSLSDTKKGTCSVCTCGTGECSNGKQKSATITYYDDEELDRFVGRMSGDYTAAEEAEFREVLETLLPEDVSDWLQSLSRRTILLPKNLLPLAQRRLSETE